MWYMVYCTPFQISMKYLLWQYLFYVLFLFSFFLLCVHMKFPDLVPDRLRLTRIIMLPCGVGLSCCQSLYYIYTFLMYPYDFCNKKWLFSQTLKAFEILRCKEQNFITHFHLVTLFFFWQRFIIEGMMTCHELLKMVCEI